MGGEIKDNIVRGSHVYEDYLTAREEVFQSVFFFYLNLRFDVSKYDKKKNPQKSPKPPA